MVYRVVFELVFERLRVIVPTVTLVASCGGDVGGSNEAVPADQEEHGFNALNNGPADGEGGRPGRSAVGPDMTTERFGAFEGGEPVQVLSSQSADPPFQVYIASGTSQTIAGSDTHMCFLGGLRGTLDEGSGICPCHYGGVYEDEGGAWRGTAEGDPLDVWINCVGHSWFISWTGGTERWVSDRHWARADSGGGCPVGTGTAWKGDAAVGITYVRGGFAGGGEYALTAQGATATTHGFVRAQDCQDDSEEVLVDAHSYFVGKPSSGLRAIFYVNDGNGRPVPTVDTAPYVASSSGFEGTVPMAYVSQAICYLVHVSGHFDGGAEWARIDTFTDTGGARWRLRAKAAIGKWTQAKARCFSRNQH